MKKIILCGALVMAFAISLLSVNLKNTFAAPGNDHEVGRPNFIITSEDNLIIYANYPTECYINEFYVVIDYAYIYFGSIEFDISNFLIKKNNIEGWSEESDELFILELQIEFSNKIFQLIDSMGCDDFQIDIQFEAFEVYYDDNQSIDYPHCLIIDNTNVHNYTYLTEEYRGLASEIVMTMVQFDPEDPIADVEDFEYSKKCYLFDF